MKHFDNQYYQCPKCKSVSIIYNTTGEPVCEVCGTKLIRISQPGYSFKEYFKTMRVVSL